MHDPVCGMTVGPDASRVEGYPEYGFCSEHCRQAFIADPGRYLEKHTVPGHEENATQESTHGLHGPPTDSSTSSAAGRTTERRGLDLPPSSCLLPPAPLPDPTAKLLGAYRDL